MRAVVVLLIVLAIVGTSQTSAACSNCTVNVSGAANGPSWLAAKIEAGSVMSIVQNATVDRAWSMSIYILDANMHGLTSLTFDGNLAGGSASVQLGHGGTTWTTSLGGPDVTRPRLTLNTGTHPETYYIVAVANGNVINWSVTISTDTGRSLGVTTGNATHFLNATSTPSTVSAAVRVGGDSVGAGVAGRAVFDIKNSLFGWFMFTDILPPVQVSQLTPPNGTAQSCPCSSPVGGASPDGPGTYQFDSQASVNGLGDFTAAWADVSLPS